MRRTFDSYPVNLTTTGQLSVAGSYDGDRSMGVTALRGREREFESLVQAAENALAGSGTTVLLEGEAGIGKTRLLDEIATRAADLGMQVRRGAAEELEQGRPFGSLIDALGAPDTAPRLGHDTGAEAARALVQDAFVDHLEHLAASSLVLALDDLQWADRATMGTLWALARRSSDMGLLLVLAFRPTPSPPGFQRLLDGCDRIGAMHLRLGPVGDAVLDDLALEVLGAPPSPALRERLRGAGGNPFVAIELLASRSPDAPDVGHTEGDLTDTQLPPTLRAVLLARFTGLSDTARRVLPVAAVLGGSARVDDLASLLGITSDEATVVVTEAVDAGLFEPTGESLSFRHDLIREALYESLPDAVRLGWHREAARLLEGRAEPTVVAQHLMLGATRGDSDTIASLRRAAEQLRDKTPHVAASLLERALSLCQVPETRAEVALERALALLQAGRAAEAEHQAGDALAAGATGEVRARATFVRALALSYLDRFGEARAGFEAALASQELDPESRARALGLRATHCVYTLALDESLETAERAMAEGTRLGVPAAVIDALLARCIVHAMRSEFDAAIDAGRDAVALAETESSVVSTTSLLGMALQSSDRFDEARVVVEEGRRRASDRGEVSGFAIQQSELAFIAWATGRWDDALTELDALSGLVEDYGIRVGEALGQGVAGNIAFHRGDAATVRTVVEKASTEGIGGGLAPRLLLARLSALVQEAEGDIEGAASLLLASMDAGRAFGVDPPRNMIGIECARLAVAAGNIAATESLVAELDNYARRATTCSARGTAAYARGVSEGDGTLLCSAAQEFRAVGRPMLVLRAMESAGTAFAAAGARDSAVASLREAHRITNDLGAVFDRRRISAVLRDLGVRIGSKERVAQATDGWESLTTAERDVAELVGEGLRNGEIADRLFVSRRTIESHVSRLYTKLGIENRVALAQMTREHQTE